MHAVEYSHITTTTPDCGDSLFNDLNRYDIEDLGLPVTIYGGDSLYDGPIQGMQFGTAAIQLETQQLLSRRQLTYAALYAVGLTRRCVAQTMFVAPGTADCHINDAFNALHAVNKRQAIARAFALGVFSLTQSSDQWTFTPRDLEIIAQLAQGDTTAAAGNMLTPPITETTVKTHLTNARRRNKLKTSQLVLAAFATGAFIESPTTSETD